MNTNPRSYTSGIGLFFELCSHLYTGKRWISLILVIKAFVILSPIIILGLLLLAPYKFMARFSKGAEKKKLDKQGSNIYPLW